jgi:hypothetical protein
VNSKGFRETFLRNNREGPTKAEMAGRKKPSRRRAQAVKKKRIEKKPGVPQGQRTPRRRAGRAQPRRNSHRLSKNRGPRRAPRARGESTERTSKKAGRPSRR